MQVRVGVQFVLAEIVVETDLSQDDIHNALVEAMKQPYGLLVLEGDEGERYLIPASSVAYIKFSKSDSPLPPGFGNTL